MIVAIYHNEDIHFEMLGYILDYCTNSNIEVHVYSYFSHIPNGNCIISFYKDFFKNLGNIVWLTSPFLIENIDYQAVFLVSDSHPEYYMIQDKCWEKVISIEHWIETRCKKYKYGVGTRHFIGKPYDYPYAFPCHVIFTETEKKMLLKDVGRPQVLFIGRFNTPSSLHFSFFHNMDNIDFHIINWKIERHYYKYLVKLPNIYFYEELSMDKLIKLMGKSHYVFFNSNVVEGYCTHKTSASLHLAFSTLCIPIIPTSWNQHYNFKSVIEYDDLEFMRPKEQLSLITDIYWEKLPQIILERVYQISHRNRIFDNAIEYIVGTKPTKPTLSSIFNLIRNISYNFPMIYVETGIGSGNTFIPMISQFRELYGIELNKSSPLQISSQNNKNIHIFYDYSDTILNEIYMKIDDSVLFFLDANSEEGFYGREEDNGSALLSELKILNNRMYDDIIIFRNNNSIKSIDINIDIDIISKYYNKSFYYYTYDEFIILIPLKRNISPNIFQVCIKPFNKYNIPPFVIQNVKDKSIGYNYELYDDNKIINFLNDFVYINTDIKDRYLSCLSAPHRKDLFSLLLLYKRGGIYWDLDQEPIVPFNEFIKDHTFVSYICVKKEDGLQIGFIASTKNNPILSSILDGYLQTDFETEVFRDYVHFTKIAGNVLKNFLQVDELNEGEYIKNGQKILLLQETWEGEAMYKTCKAELNGKVMFNVRYHDYPWNLRD